MNLYIQIRESVIDYKFYQKIKKQRFGQSIGYLLMLFLIVYTMGAIKDYVDFGRAVDLYTQQLSEKTADFKLENGEFKYFGEMPVYIQNENGISFVFDTTGKVSEDEVKDYYNVVLVTKDSFVCKIMNVVINRTHFADIKSVTLTKQQILQDMPRLRVAEALALCLMFILAFTMKLLNVMLLAIFGMSLCRAYRVFIPYSQMLNICAYVLTMPILLELANKLSGYAIPFFTFVYWAISLAYLGRVIISERFPDGESDRQEDL